MLTEHQLCVCVLLVAAPLTVLLLRLIYILPCLGTPRDAIFTKSDSSTSSSPPQVSVMILLGSGGHTGEMMRMVEKLDVSRYKRTWLVSSGDTTSLKRAQEYEEKAQSGKPTFASLYRARQVGEPFVSSVVSTVRSFVSVVLFLQNLPKPDILLVNGPGTCVPVAYVLFVMKYLGLCNTKIIYVESLARVSTLSLSGRLIMPIANRFIVQWKTLARQYRRAEYHGILV